MAQTLIPTTVMVGPYPTTPLVATSLDIAFLAADFMNGNYFVAQNVYSAIQAGGGVTYVGGDVIVFQNTTVGPITFTLTSQPDPQGRSGDITAYLVGAGVTSVFNLAQIAGWANGSNKVYLAYSAIGLSVAVLQR